MAWGGDVLSQYDMLEVPDTFDWEDLEDVETTVPAAAGGDLWNGDDARDQGKEDHDECPF